MLACEACGWAAGCPRCSARLVLHSADRRLRCHHCGAEEAVPRACPTCGNVDLRPLGPRHAARRGNAGRRSFPQARILRIDRDSARRRGELARTLEGIGRGEGDILVGTQLLAKGHDFPNLTLVCVLNADSALLSTDYRVGRAAVRHARAGRRARRPPRAARRSAGADALSRAPDVSRRSMRHDYAGFAEAQLAERESAGFPPFVHEAALRAEARQARRSDGVPAHGGAARAGAGGRARSTTRCRT